MIFITYIFLNQTNYIWPQGQLSPATKILGAPMVKLNNRYLFCESNVTTALFMQIGYLLDRASLI